MSIFVVTKQIRIQHCDPAGIVFTPQYFNLFAEVLEDWYEYGIGVSFKELIFSHQRAIPLRKFNGEFLIASRLGDLLEFHLTVQQVRGASIDIHITGHDLEALRCFVDMQLVQMELKSKRPIRWSDEWREKLLAYAA